MASDTSRVEQTCRSGERMIAGRPHVLDIGLLLDYEAQEAVCHAPPDLTALSLTDLKTLWFFTLRVVANTRQQDADALALLCRIESQVIVRSRPAPPVWAPDA